MTSVRRILVAEDIPAVARDMEWNLCEMGYDVLGPFARLDQVMTAAANESFDLAVFDVNLRGELVFPAVVECNRRSIPVILVSGYDDRRTPEEFAALPHLQKPIDPRQINKIIRELLRSRN